MRASAALLLLLIAACSSRPEYGIPYSVDGTELTVVVDPSPPKAGDLQFEFTLDRGGKPDETTRLDATVSGATTRGAAVNVRVMPKAPGRYTGYVAVAKGTWELEVELLIGARRSKVIYRLLVD
jgi:hypothetical protein